MAEKGYPALMVGYAINHRPGVYKVYNPKTNRIVLTCDVTWTDFKPQQLESAFNMFKPRIDLENIFEESKLFK